MADAENAARELRRIKEEERERERKERMDDLKHGHIFKKRKKKDKYKEGPIGMGNDKEARII